MKTTNKIHIVFAGSGYVSVWAYKYLMRHAGKAVKNGSIKLTVITPSLFHAFHGFTGEFLNGFLSLEHRESPLKEIMPLAYFIQGKVTSIDQNNNTAHYLVEETQAKEELCFDQLVLGVGSSDVGNHIPGLLEYGLSVKKDGGIAECRKRILLSLQKAEHAHTEEELTSLLTFTVAGGGFAATEVCGNLCEYLDTLKPHFPVLKEKGYQVHLVYGSKEILPQIKKKNSLLRRYAEKSLRKLNVQFHPNMKVNKVNENTIVTDAGTTISSSTLIYAIGQSPVPITGVLPFKQGSRGGILSDEFLKARGFENIWIGGDCAEVPRPYRKPEVCRADALWAIKHGTRIGKNLARLSKNKSLKRFNYPGLGQTASFYKGKGILELYGIPLIGWGAWLNRIGFFVYFYPNKGHLVALIKALFQSRKLFEEEIPEIKTSEPTPSLATI